MPDLLAGTVEFLQQYGYLTKAAARKVSSFEDVSLTAALAKYQRMDANVERFRVEAGSDLLTDGNVGPATLMAMAVPRCGRPDVGRSVPEQVLGTGGWKNCHGADGFHQAIAYVDDRNLPGFLEPVWGDVLKLTQQSYAEIGLLWRFIDGDRRDILTGERIDGSVNTDITFTRGSGWIGLAIVGNGSNQQCSSRIWAKFDYRYAPANVVREWTTLVKHELGHNCGLQHTRGGVMNPGIVNGLPASWRGDPAEGTLRRWFGGEPVDIPNGPDEPEPPEPPTDGDWPGVGEVLGHVEFWNGKTGIIRAGLS